MSYLLSQKTDKARCLISSVSNKILLQNLEWEESRGWCEADRGQSSRFDTKLITFVAIATLLPTIRHSDQHPSCSASAMRSGGDARDKCSEVTCDKWQTFDCKGSEVLAMEVNDRNEWQSTGRCCETWWQGAGHEPAAMPACCPLKKDCVCRGETSQDYCSRGLSYSDPYSPASILQVNLTFSLQPRLYQLCPSVTSSTTFLTWPPLSSLIMFGTFYMTE